MWDLVANAYQLPHAASVTLISADTIFNTMADVCVALHRVLHSDIVRTHCRFFFKIFVDVTAGGQVQNCVFHSSHQLGCSRKADIHAPACKSSVPVGVGRVSCMVEGCTRTALVPDPVPDVAVATSV